MAYQLSNVLPALRPHISDAIAQNPDIFQRGLREQWQHLICHPLSILGLEKLGFRQDQPYILLIDALDECDGEMDVKLMLELIPQLRNLEKVIRVFITSRPELPIRLGFDKMAKEAYRSFVLHEIEESVIEQDISLFFRERLNEIRRQHRAGIPENWPAEEDIKCLCHSADKLFIYAATVCRFIDHRIFDPRDRLCQLLQEGTEKPSSTTTGELDVVYLSVLKASLIGGENEKDAKHVSSLFRNVVGVIVLLFDTLPSSALASLLCLKTHTINGLLGSLASVIHVTRNDRIRLLHPSFRDFLTDQTRCTEPHFLVNGPKTHEDILLNCLDRISTGLRRDICNLERPGLLGHEIENIIVANLLPPDIEYAWSHWVHHLKGSQRELFMINSSDRILEFLQSYFLHWLEALSLMQKTSEAVFALEMLLNIMTISSHEVKSNHRELLLFIYDARRFLLKNRPEIEKAPLQVYCSALLFSPTMSRVRCQYQQDTPPWVKIRTTGQVTEDWDPLLQVCEGHFGAVSSVAFSSDGKILASASHDSTIRIWDPFTGACRSILKGHSSLLTSVAFSPDGKLIASASYDCPVWLWDAATGACRRTLYAHSNTVTAVVFSPDGKLLASSSDDKTIRLWDTVTGACGRTLDGHSRWVTSVAFSPDGNALASASHDNTVRLWDTFTGACQRTLKGHSHWTNSVAFSPDGRLLASTSYDKTVRLWDPFTGTCQRTLIGHSTTVTSVVFLPDGKLVASTSEDNTIRLWDPLSGVCKSTLKGRSLCVTSVAASPDGRFLASASHDNTVRLWDPFTRPCQTALNGDLSPVSSVAFSPNGRLLASASIDGTVRIWNVLTGACQIILNGHSDAVNSVVFSADGSLLASASFDYTVRLWDVVTGACRSTLNGHSSSVKLVVFSPDGKLLGSASEDNTIRLWNTVTGACQSTLCHHSSQARLVVFSPNGRLLASASEENNVMIWDVFTGKCKINLNDYYSYWVVAVAFSPNEKLLASASDDNTVRLWNIVTEECQSILSGHSSSVTSVAFSSNGEVLASASEDNTVRFWAVRSTIQLQTLNTILPVTKLNFSSNGSCLETDQGKFAISIDKTNFQGACPLNGSLPFPISINEDWVLWGTERVVLLPVDMRPRCLVIRDNILAMGHVSGRVTILAFDVDFFPVLK